MSLKVYYDKQIDQSLLDDRTVAIIGYGAQGRAHALNLRDSGINVTVGQREGRGFDNAIADGFRPVSISEAAKATDFICIMLPDEIHGTVFESQIRETLSKDDIVLCCHGFSFLYGLIEPPEGVASLLVAPKGAGHMVRSAYENGGGVPCLAAVGPNVDHDKFFAMALAYAGAIGGAELASLKRRLLRKPKLIYLANKLCYVVVSVIWRSPRLKLWSKPVTAKKLPILNAFMN